MSTDLAKHNPGACGREESNSERGDGVTVYESASFWQHDGYQYDEVWWMTGCARKENQWKELFELVGFR
jgi:hypothetical protein